MTSQTAQNFRLTVLNPGGSDPEQPFHRLAAPGEGTHPPINFHAFAACTFGAFHRDTRSALAEKTPVLLLLRSDFRASERALTDLKKEGRTVAVSLKETGLHQIAQQLRDPGKLSRFMKIVVGANACIATTPQAAEIYQRVRPKHDPVTVIFIPTPYPIEDQRWDFSVARDEHSNSIQIRSRASWHLGLHWDKAVGMKKPFLSCGRLLCRRLIQNSRGICSATFITTPDSMNLPKRLTAAVWNSIQPHLAFTGCTPACCSMSARFRRLSRVSVKHYRSIQINLRPWLIWASFFITR